MSKIRRFSLISFSEVCEEGKVAVKDDSNGWLVQYEDCAVLQEKLADVQQKLDELAVENAALKESRDVLAKNALEACNEIYCAGYRNTALHDGFMESTGNRNTYPNPIRVMVDEAVRQVGTPATSAYLNSVRAEGVMMLADKMEDNGYHSVAVGAKVFAAQLRSQEAK